MIEPSALSESIRAMGDTFDKLQCLNYKRHFVKNLRKSPIRGDHFVFPSKNPSEQFTHFIDVALWLLSIISGNGESFDIDQYDDPNTIVQKLLIELKKIGYDRDCSLNKMKQGYGETVTVVLDYLTDRALEKKGFRFEGPVYKKDGRGSAGDGEEEDHIADEVGVDEITLSDDGDKGESDNWDDSSIEEEKHHDDAHADKIIESTIDPVQWRTELERVASKLIGELIVFLRILNESFSSAMLSLFADGLR